MSRSPWHRPCWRPLAATAKRLVLRGLTVSAAVHVASCMRVCTRTSCFFHMMRSVLGLCAGGLCGSVDWPCTLAGIAGALWQGCRAGCQLLHGTAVQAMLVSGCIEKGMRFTGFICVAVVSLSSCFQNMPLGALNMYTPAEASQKHQLLHTVPAAWCAYRLCRRTYHAWMDA